MDLRVYLAERRIAVADLARRVGVSRTHLYAVLQGRALPSPRLAWRIENATDGAVPWADLCHPARGVPMALPSKAKEA